MPGAGKARGNGWESTPLRLAALAEELATRIPQPVDELEVAAVLESMGITDEVAAQDFGEPDVFAFAARVYPLVRLIARRRERSGTTEDSRPERGAEARPPAPGVVMLMVSIGPLALLGLISWTLATDGWSTADTALFWGISAGMVLVAGPTFAVGRRSAILAGFGYVAQQRLYLRGRALWSVGIMTLAAVGSLGLAAAAGVSIDLAAPAAFGAGGIGVTWTLVNILLFAGRPGSVVGSLALALALGAVAGAAGSPAAGLYAGTLAAGALLTAAALSLGHGVEAPPQSSRPALLAVESLPYSLYALLAIGLMIAPSALAWLAETAGARAETAGRIGLSFTVAIVPLAVSAIFVERSTRAFGDFLRASARRDDLGRFRGAVRRFHALRLVTYAGLLGGLSVIFAATYLPLTLQTDVEEAVAGRYLLAGLAFYWLLGCTQFTALLLLNLSRPWPAAAPFAAGLAAAAGLTAATAVFDLSSGIPIVATVAAAVGLALSLRNWRVVTSDLARVYAMAY